MDGCTVCSRCSQSLRGSRGVPLPLTFSFTKRDKNVPPGANHRLGKRSQGPWQVDPHMQDPSAQHSTEAPGPMAQAQEEAALPWQREQGPRLPMSSHKLSFHMSLNKPGTATRMLKPSFGCLYILLTQTWLYTEFHLQMNPSASNKLVSNSMSNNFPVTYKLPRN